MQRPAVRLITPCVIVSHLQRTIDFYVGQLGFTDSETWGEPPCFAMMHRNQHDLMFSLAESEAQPRPNGHGVWDMFIKVSDAKAELAVLEAAGVSIARGLTTTAYHMLEIDVLDPDGYRICFGSDL
jgi:catechol 2,3-dioxygenase-like lactoylglutathione lyase family enzyme